MFSPMEIAAVVGLGILIFGAERLPKLARSMGHAKKEFMVGQAEADVAAEQAREDARKQAQADVRTTEVATGPTGGIGGATVVPDPISGAPGPTTIAPPHS
jgi:sec-independent protein translocase protein TatA